MFKKNFLSEKICYLKVIGKLKDEFGGVIANEFVGLKSKMYSMKKIDGK